MNLSPLPTWLLGFAAGFAGGLYFGLPTFVAIMIIVPIFVAAHRILMGLAGFSTGLGLMSLWLSFNPPAGCSGLGGCPQWVTFEGSLGGALTLLGIAITAAIAVRSAKRQPSESAPEPVSDSIGRAGAGGRHFRVGVIVPAAIVAVVAAVALLVPRAGDVAVPTTIDTAMAADATSKCLAGGGAGTARLVIQDQRGPTAALLFVQGEDLVTCVASRGSTGSIDVTASGHGKPSAATGDLAVVTGMMSPSGPAYAGLRVIVGTVSSQAASVTLQRTDGVLVTATVRGGYFLAWWPSIMKASVVTSLDAAGNRLQQLQNVEALQP